MPDEPTKTAAQLIRELAEKDPEGHARALARGYGIDPDRDARRAEAARVGASIDDGSAARLEVALRTVERDEARAEVARLTGIVQAVAALHPKIENPRHGCCAPPKLCNGHEPECGGTSHGLNRPDWPCADLRAIGVPLAAVPSTGEQDDRG